MARVITFSRFYPSYHPKAGQPTHFVEKIIKALPYSLHDDSAWGNLELCKKLDLAIDLWKEIGLKHHTIRAGHRWKEGEWFSPRVWSGKPYASKMIQFAPDIQIKKIFLLDIEDGYVWIDRLSHCTINDDAFDEIALNDGLSPNDLLNWFQIQKQDVKEHQIICWNENINY